MDVANNMGLFTSDQALLTNATLKKFVDGFVKSANKWRNIVGGVPRGCVPVLVCDGDGSEGERFVVRVEALQHPSFTALLEMAAQEFGYKQEGVLRIPCDVHHFKEVLTAAFSPRSTRD